MGNINDILRLQNTSGSLDKVNILKELKDDVWFRSFIYYALNPLLTYNLSEKTIRDELDDVDAVRFFKDIFDCCRYLSRLRGIDSGTIRQVKAFLNTFPEDEREVYIKLLSKTLRLGITSKTVNDVWDNFIPSWEVQQAYSIERYPIKGTPVYWATQKLNGVRATFYNNQLIARSGLPYEHLDHLINSKLFKFARANGIVLDGELTLKDKGSLSDNEAFRVATGILNSDSEDKTAICFTIFDAIPESDFDSAEPKVKYSFRREILNSLPHQDEYVKVLEVLYNGTDQSQIDILLDRMVSEDKEGLMVNLDVPYKRKRHRGILKVKRFYTVDLKIKRFEEGTGRLAGTLGSIVVDFDGNEVSVGSGIDDETRASLWEHKDEYIGSLCEIKYKEISYDKKTRLKSLQFPIFIQIRNDKSDVSLD